MGSSYPSDKNPIAVDYFNKGILSAKSGYLRNAIACFRKAIRLNPDWKDPHGHLAFTYFNYAWFRYALREYQHLLNTGDENVEVLLIISDLYNHLGQSDLSHKYRQEADQKDPQFCIQYKSLRISSKSIKIKCFEEFRWFFHCVCSLPVNIIQKYPYLKLIYQCPSYYLNLFFIFWIDFWRKYISKFYDKPWINRNSIRINHSQLIRFHRKYEDDFLKFGLLYNRNIEYLIALNWIGANPGERILEIGAGKSIMLVMLALYNCEVTITDVDSYVMKLKKFLKDETICRIVKSGQIRVEIADATKLSYPDNSFDKIISIGSLEHLPGDMDKAAFCEISRILRPGGIAVITLEGGWQYNENWIKHPYYQGIQYHNQCAPTETSKIDISLIDKQDKTQGYLVFIRFYDDQALLDRVVKPSGLELLEFGYYGDIIPLRINIQEGQGNVYKLLRSFQPVLSSLFYCHYKSSAELKNKHAPIAYIVLRKKLVIENTY